MSNSNAFTPPADFLDLLLDAVCVVEPDGRFVFVSAASEQVFGYRPEEMVGRLIFDFVHPDDLEYTKGTAATVMAAGSVRQVENRYIRKDGEIVHIMWTARWLGESRLRIGVARDITERRRNEAVQEAMYAILDLVQTAADVEELYSQLHNIVNALEIPGFAEDHKLSSGDENRLHLIAAQIAEAVSRKRLLDRLNYMAQYDPLTGLPNRQLLSDRIQTSLARARRQNTLMAVFFIDLNGFKRVNDSFGHAAGDELLQQVAARLNQSVRESDTAARLGGDEFVILVERISQRDSTNEVAAKIEAAFAKPFFVGGTGLTITPSLGAAVFPFDGEDEFTLLRFADDAMYRSKGRG